MTQDILLKDINDREGIRTMKILKTTTTDHCLFDTCRLSPSTLNQVKRVYSCPKYSGPHYVIFATVN